MLNTRQVIVLVTVLFFSVGVSAQSRGLRIESVDLDKTEIVLGCQPGWSAAEGMCNDSTYLKAKVKIAGGEPKNVRFVQTVSGGRVVQGSEKDQFAWDLSGAAPGTYTLMVSAAKQTDEDYADFKTVTVTVKQCPKCGGGDSCISGAVSSPEYNVKAGEKAIFVAQVSGGEPDTIYSWTVSAGTIVSGQGGKTITVDTTGMGGTNITATVNWPASPTGYRCSTSASESIAILSPPEPVLVDELQTRGTNCEELLARLDNYFSQLSNNPSDQGYVVIYQSPDSRSAGKLREWQVRNHVGFRRWDMSRLTILHGGVRKDAKVQLWRAQPGAGMPEMLSDDADFTVPEPKKDPAKPYIYATEFSDGIPGCDGPAYDLSAYAEVLKGKKGTKGNIVIGEPTPAKFRSKEREIRKELERFGIARNLIQTFYKRVKPRQLAEFVELWVLPPVESPFLKTTATTK